MQVVINRLSRTRALCAIRWRNSNAKSTWNYCMGYVMRGDAFKMTSLQRCEVLVRANFLHICAPFWLLFHMLDLNLARATRISSLFRFRSYSFNVIVITGIWTDTFRLHRNHNILFTINALHDARSTPSNLPSHCCCCEIQKENLFWHPARHT